MVVPGGGIALDHTRWISSRPAFLLPVRVLGKLFHPRQQGATLLPFSRNTRINLDACLGYCYTALCQPS